MFGNFSADLFRRYPACTWSVLSAIPQLSNSVIWIVIQERYSPRGTGPSECLYRRIGTGAIHVAFRTGLIIRNQNHVAVFVDRFCERGILLRVVLLSKKDVVVNKLGAVFRQPVK